MQAHKEAYLVLEHVLSEQCASSDSDLPTSSCACDTCCSHVWFEPLCSILGSAIQMTLAAPHFSEKWQRMWIMDHQRSLQNYDLQIMEGPWLMSVKRAIVSGLLSSSPDKDTVAIELYKHNSFPGRI